VALESQETPQQRLVVVNVNLSDVEQIALHCCHLMVGSIATTAPGGGECQLIRRGTDSSSLLSPDGLQHRHNSAWRW